MTTTGRRYSIGAGIADFYVAGIIFGAFGGLYVAASRKPVPIWWSLFGIAVTLTVIAIYYSVMARRVAFRTVGEVMMGRRIVAGRKEWTNPYGVNRAALFGVLFIALVSAGNLWDSISDERFYATLTMPVVLGRAVFLGSLLAGILMIGHARVAGVVLVAGYFALTGIANFLAAPPEGVSSGITRGLGMFNLFTALVAAVVLSRYQRAAKSLSMEPPGSNVQDVDERAGVSSPSR